MVTVMSIYIFHSFSISLSHILCDTHTVGTCSRQIQTDRDPFDGSQARTGPSPREEPPTLGLPLPSPGQPQRDHAGTAVVKGTVGKGGGCYARGAGGVGECEGEREAD